MERILEKTDDGSTTLFVPALNEHYHSTKGAVTESQHIFIDMGLKACAAPMPRILEIGFGTGLNALLTLREAEKLQRPVHYTGIELYPLSWETVEKLEYHQNQPPLCINGRQVELGALFEKMHSTPWNEDCLISPNFTLCKQQKDITCFGELEQLRADVIYFDAFAPEKQPEIWSQELFNKLFERISPQGILTTYCAKGAVRRMLQTAGFIVERLPGPPGGKREILRAQKKENNN